MARSVTVTVPAVPRRAAKGGVLGVALFLAVVLIGGRLPIYHQPYLDVWTADPSSQGIEAKEAFVRRLDSLADRLPETKMLTTRQNMIDWALEILPYMDYEGIVEGPAVVPEDIALFLTFTDRAFHLAGEALCRTSEGAVRGPIWLNSRFTNPVSAWYGKETTLGVLVHELVHMQGGPFCTGESADLEANTQIAAMEILAAMVNHGNEAALRPLLLELRGMGLAALQYALPADDYIAFLGSISNDPFEMSRAEKALRYWRANGGNVALQDILRKYNVVPFDAIIEGVQDGTVERIQLPYWNTDSNQVGYRPLMADDLQAFLLNVDAYVAAVTEGL